MFKDTGGRRHQDALGECRRNPSCGVGNTCTGVGCGSCCEVFVTDGQWATYAECVRPWRRGADGRFLWGHKAHLESHPPSLLVQSRPNMCAAVRCRSDGMHARRAVVVMDLSLGDGLHATAVGSMGWREPAHSKLDIDPLSRSKCWSY